MIIVKKPTPVYTNNDNVTEKYFNLRKAVNLTSFKYLYPNIPEILVNQYGLQPDEKIVVFWTKEVSLPHFNRYRVKFRKVFSGKVEGLGEFLKSRLIVHKNHNSQ